MSAALIWHESHPTLNGRKNRDMASSIRITCPGCNQEFLVSPQFEKLKIAAKCPFCENEFAIADGKNIVRPTPILLVK